jgi:alpha-1,3-glucosyltransferase
VASYQVHEKAVMLPLLPLALLSHRLPLTAAVFNLVGVWSMWPLLAKDGLLMPAAVTSAFYAAVSWPDATSVAAGDAAVFAAAVNWALPLSWARVAAPKMRPWLGMAVAALLAVMGILSAAAVVVPPPASLPDLHPYLSAVAGAGMLTAQLAALTLVQLQLVFGGAPR